MCLTYKSFLRYCTIEKKKLESSRILWKLISKAARKDYCIFIFLKSWLESKIHTIQGHHASRVETFLLAALQMECSSQH